MPIASVKVTINGTTTTLTDNGDGTYSGTLAAPNKTSYNVNSGHYYPVTVVATNTAGTATTADDTHSSLGSALRLVVKETTAPTISISSPTNNQFLSKASPTFDFVITDEMNGSGVMLNNTKLVIDGVTYTPTNSSTSTWSPSSYNASLDPDDVRVGFKCGVTLVTPLTDGEHTMYITTEDNDGNKATSSTITFTTDTVAPALSVTSPAADGYVNSAALTVVGNVTDSTSGIKALTISLNGTSVGAVTVTNGTFSKAVTLTSGTNTIVITAQDKAGRVTTITRTITLDTSTPVIAAVSITPNPVNVGSNYTVKITVQ